MADTWQEDIKALWGALMHWAIQELKENGTFSPFGAAMQLDNKIALVDAAGFDSPRDVIEAGLRESARKGEYKATAIICDIRAADTETGALFDAVHLAIDHVENHSIVVFRPYTIDAEKNVIFGQEQAQKGDFSMFPPNPPKKPWWKR
jgi:hypothetical protein